MQYKWLIDLVVLAAIWGSSFLFMRIATPEFGAFGLTFLRTFIATLFLMCVMTLRNRDDIQHLFKHWRLFIAIAAFSTAIPFSLWAFVSLFLESGPMAVINATTPMFGALVAYIWLKESLSKSAMIGLFLGFVGVFILMIVPQNGTQLAVIPVLAGLAATTCYGINASITRRTSQKTAHLTPLTITTGSQLYSSILLVPFTLLFLPEQNPSQTAWLSIIVLGVVCTGFAFSLFFKLMVEQGITRTLSVTYLIPLFAMLWGSLFLGEQLELRTLVGGGFILLGVAFTTGYIKIGRKPVAVGE